MKFKDIVGTPRKVIKMNFSIGMPPVEIVDKPTMKNFSENSKEALVDYQLQCFSLLERVRLAKRTPRQILRLRVAEVARFLRMSNVDKIKENKSLIVTYINEYVYEIILKLMNEPGMRPINLIKELGLPTLMKNMKSVRDLQRVLIRTKREFNQRGYLSKIIQDLLAKSYSEFMTELLKSIDERYIHDKSKRGILSGNESVEELNPIKLAAFSYELASENEVLELLYKLIEEDTPDYSELIAKLDSMKPEEVFKDAIMDDPDLTKLLNDYIVTKSEDSKLGIINYMNRTVNFSNDLKIPAFFNMNMEQVNKLSSGGINNISEPVLETNSNTVEENVSDLNDLIPNMIVDDKNYKVGTYKKFGKTTGFVAIRKGKNFSVRLYNNIKSINNFSEWSKPSKSIIVSKMDDLLK